MFLKDRPAGNSHVISHVYPDTFHVAYHFGFCPLTNEYQVLQVTMSLYKDMIADSLARVVTSFNIFKLGTGLWRGIEVDRSDLPFDYHSVSSIGLEFPYIYGAIHWMHGTQDLIVVFDLKDERGLG